MIKKYSYIKNRFLRNYVKSERELFKSKSKRNNSLNDISSNSEPNHHHLNMSYNNIFMQLRKLCNHPFLLLEEIKDISDEMYFKYLISSSGKFTVLRHLLSKLVAQGRKIIIFSQMTMVLNLLESLLSSMNIQYARYVFINYTILF